MVKRAYRVHKRRVYKEPKVRSKKVRYTDARVSGFYFKVEDINRHPALIFIFKDYKKDGTYWIEKAIYDNFDIIVGRKRFDSSMTKRDLINWLKENYANVKEISEDEAYRIRKTR